MGGFAMQYVLVETCFAAPEQYDVYRGNTRIGGIRVRNGCLTADAGMVTVYDSTVEGDSRMAPGERYSQLMSALQAIHRHYGREAGFAFYVQGG
jgi:hypothetical protein